MKKAILLMMSIVAVVAIISCKDAGKKGVEGVSPQTLAAGAVSTSGEALATVNGLAITDADIMPQVKGQLQKIAQKIYEVKKEALDKVVEEKLIETAAKAKGQTAEQYISEQVDAKVEEPSETEVKAYFEARKAQAPGKEYKDLESQIRNYLKDARKNARMTKLISSLRETADVKVNIQPPRIEFDATGLPFKGDANAKVTVVEFTDYQCPYCAKASSSVSEVWKKYGDKVKFVLADFPLSFHKASPKAHEAAHCAGDQNKYWEYSDVLWKNQTALDVPKLKSYAKQLNLNSADFDKCLDSGKHESDVANGLKLGASVGVTGTPSFLINGISVSGAVPFSSLETIIDGELGN